MPPKFQDGSLFARRATRGRLAREEVMSKMDPPKGKTYFEWATNLGRNPGRLWE